MVRSSRRLAHLVLLVAYVIWSTWVPAHLAFVPHGDAMARGHDPAFGHSHDHGDHDHLSSGALPIGDEPEQTPPHAPQRHPAEDHRIDVVAPVKREPWTPPNDCAFLAARPRLYLIIAPSSELGRPALTAPIGRPPPPRPPARAPPS